MQSTQCGSATAITGWSRERCGHTIPISPRLRMRPRGSIRSIWRELIGLTRCEHHSSGCQPTPGGDRVRRVLIAPTAIRNLIVNGTLL